MSEPLSLGIAQAAATSAAAEPDSERVLLERLAAGGDARRLAVGTLYRRFAPRFRRYFQAQRLGEAEAEDLVQDVFVKVVRACGEFRGEARADTWLWTIARNTLISKLRARQPETSLENFDLDALTAADPNLQTVPAEVGGTVEDCVGHGIARFGKDYPERARVIGFLVIEEWSVEAIAQLLGRSPGATREFISQCRKKLRPYIEKCFDLLQESAP
jgi:RNA polymerase sigma-70 factor (ECF subfamily)